MNRYFVFVAAILIHALPLQAASILKSYATSIAGESQLGAAGPPLSCTTSGPNPQLTAALTFGSLPAVGFPIDAGCGVQQNLVESSGAASPSASNSALNRTFAIDGVETVTFNGSSQGRAQYFNVGATATATYSGSSNNMTRIGSEAFGISRETVTISGQTGQPGTFRATITLDGSITVSGNGSAHLIFLHFKDDGVQFTPVRFSVDPRLGAPSAFVVNPVAGAPVFTLSNTAISGSTQFTFDIPFTFGAPFDISIGLYASVLPATTGSFNSTFLTSAKLTGIAILDAGGNPVPNFSILSGSGTQYGPGGIIPPVTIPPGTFLSLARSGGAIPGGVGLFGSFPQPPSLGAPRVGFFGAGSAGQQGIYTCLVALPGDPCRPLADLSKAIPNGSGTFTAFSNLVLSRLSSTDASAVRAAFLGGGSGGQQGVYTCETAIPTDPCRRIADRSTAIPGGTGAFTSFSQLAMSGSVAGFVATGSGQAGVYTCLTSIPTDPCRPVATLGTPIPAGTGTFTSFNDVALAVDITKPDPPPVGVVFRATGIGQQGVYVCQPGDPCRPIANLATSIPGGSGAFTSFGPVAAAIESGKPAPVPFHVAFIGAGSGQQGVFVCEVVTPVDPCRPIATLATPVPQGAGPFSGFTALAASADHVAFQATTTGGQSGIYIASTLTKVISTGDALDGKTISELRLGRFGLDGTAVTFAVTFTDGTQGIFSSPVPSTPPPPPPVTVPFSNFQPSAAIDVRNGAFAAAATITLGPASNGISPATESVTLRVGTYTTTVPAGSFRFNGFGNYTYRAANLLVVLQYLGGQKWFYSAVGWNVNMAGTVNPVPIGLTIGNDAGAATAYAFFGFVPH